MNFLSAYHTDKGIKKSTNQDALLIKVANTSHGKIGLFTICDGMGGLSKGELASSTVIHEISNWFEAELPKLLGQDDIYEEIKLSMIKKIKYLNRNISSYGKENNCKLGTTITAMLLINNKYIITHVGDSRAYKIGNDVIQLTKDQSFVQREVDRGNLTNEEAKVHPKRNLLIECVGVTPTVEVLDYIGDIKTGESYLLCTDGFYHKISENEMINNLNGKRLLSEDKMKKMSIDLVELVKKRNERDNISLILVKVI